MYTKRIKWYVASGAVASLGLTALQFALAQDPLANPRIVNGQATNLASPYGTPTAVDFEGNRLIAQSAPTNVMAAILGAAAEMRDAKNDEAKQKAETQLRELLSKYFQEDMKRRATELDAMNRRLKKLNEQLERREAKMDEIIDLQMKVLANEADGLGFFTSAQTPVLQNWSVGHGTTTQSSQMDWPSDPFQASNPRLHPAGENREATTVTLYPAPTATMPIGRPQVPQQVLPPATPAPSTPTAPPEAVPPPSSFDPAAAGPAVR